MRKKRKRTNKRRTYQKELLADFVMVQGVPLRDFPHGSVNVKVWVCHCAQRRENENKVNGMHTPTSKRWESHSLFLSASVSVSVS